MALSEDFKNAVEENKTTRVRIMLKDSLLLDPTGKEFDEMLKYAKESIPDIIDAHDGETFKTPDEWDEDYLNDQMVTVVNDFSSERVDQLKKIVNKLYGKKPELKFDANERIERNSSISDQREDSISGTKMAGACVAVVGAGLLIGGLVVADAPIAVPIIGGVAIGVGAYLFFKK